MKGCIIMLNEKLLSILAHPVDGAVSIVTCSEDGPHLVNTWNSYITVTSDDKFLIPAYGFLKTEKNLGQNNAVILSVANKEVEGYNSKGTGFIITGTAQLLKSGEEYSRMKEKYSWLRAVLEVTVTSAKQTL